MLNDNNQTQNLALKIPMQDGKIMPATVEDFFEAAKIYIKSEMLPKSYNTPEKVITGLQYAKEVGLPIGLISLRQIAVINGSPSLWGDLPLAIVRNSKELEIITEYLLDEKGKKICMANDNINAEAFSAFCQVKRKGMALSEEYIFTMYDAKQAGLLGKDCWVKYPKDMLKYKIRGRALKDHFSDILNGMAIAEFDYGVSPEHMSERDLTEISKTDNDITQELNDNSKEWSKNNPVVKTEKEAIIVHPNNLEADSFNAASEIPEGVHQLNLIPEVKQEKNIVAMLEKATSADELNKIAHDNSEDIKKLSESKQKEARDAFKKSWQRLSQKVATPELTEEEIKQIKEEEKKFV